MPPEFLQPYWHLFLVISNVSLLSQALAANDRKQGLTSYYSIAATANIPGNSAIAARRLIQLTAILRQPSLSRGTVHRAPAPREMATLDAREVKHKVTVVGSGNWSALTKLALSAPR